MMCFIVSDSFGGTCKEAVSIIYSVSISTLSIKFEDVKTLLSCNNATRVLK